MCHSLLDDVHVNSSAYWQYEPIMLSSSIHLLESWSAVHRHSLFSVFAVKLKVTEI